MTEKGRHILVYERQDGLFDWQVVARNGEITASSLQGFTTSNDAADAAEREHPDLDIFYEFKDGD